MALNWCEKPDCTKIRQNYTIMVQFWGDPQIRKSSPWPSGLSHEALRSESWSRQTLFYPAARPIQGCSGHNPGLFGGVVKAWLAQKLQDL
jgi:hypothetical protein